MDPNKIKAIEEWPIPTCVKDVQSFHGLANYYRQYIRGFSKEVKPMMELLKKDKEFEWGPRQQESFDRIKDMFRRGDIRQHFNPELPNFVDTDASDYAIGARLQQPGPDGKLRLVAYYTRTITPAEQNYDIYNKELLAIVCALKK
ncbi:to reverse transcriptase [Aspergillus sclerotialis]|uniref:To reverse transcriptase n=1 Tax=Aspergillus sclerotialis TaxID=2070753 RepID=A0A3A2Z7R9_9EURO|nr:to reverse transcriptase [Aspergillus sclerotialis]